MTIATTARTITEHEAAQVERANATSATPVVFVHGLWLLPSSWDRWVTRFEEAGYVALTPGWPDDPDTVAEAREHPEVLAGKGISEIADYEEAIIRRLDRKPVIIGHSFGGLLTMILAGRGLAAASVAVSPAPFRGVLPLPISALRTASVALSRSINAQAEHWMRLGMLAELYPDLDYRELSRLLIRAEQQGGLDIGRLCALPAEPPLPHAAGEN